MLTALVSRNQALGRAGFHLHAGKVRAETIARAMSLALMMFVLGIAVFWIMQIIQTPFPSAVSGKGITFYNSQSDISARALFGEKSFDPSRLALKGIVITEQSAEGAQGLALIEVDGKEAEAISIGEMMPPGVRLIKITPTSAIVSYQGREFTLQQ